MGGELRRLSNLEALARAKAGIAQAKSNCDRLANAEIDADLDAAFEAALSDAAAECGTLNLPALSALLRQLADVARKAVSAGRSEELALEMATALLFAEHGLQQIRHLPDDFAGHADTIGARLQALVAGDTPPEPAQWQQGLTSQMQQDDTVVALAIPALFGGAIFTETIFNWPGMGQLLIGAVGASDWPVAMGVVIITAGLTILANFLADVAYVVVDPRIRY